MSNLTYVSTVNSDNEWTGILYAGNDIEKAFERVKCHFKEYKMATLDYYVYVWKDGEMIKDYEYDEEEDEFIE